MKDKVIIKVNEDLHPKTKRFPFTDKKGDEYRSVSEAFTKVTQDKAHTMTVGQIIEVLARIILAQIMAHRNKLGGLIRSTMGMAFILDQKTVDFLPGQPSQGWPYLYGVAIVKARNLFLDMANPKPSKPTAINYEESTGKVPQGAQPCLKCGGEGQEAGCGHFLAVAGNYPGGWKHIGPCFDCLPKGSDSGRGLGYITRGQARRNLNYYKNHKTQWEEGHNGCENFNLWNPDDSKLWKYVPMCELCSAQPSKGVEIIIGRNGSKTLCTTCVSENPEEAGVNMTPVDLNIESEEIPT